MPPCALAYFQTLWGQCWRDREIDGEIRESSPFYKSRECRALVFSISESSVFSAQNMSVKVRNFQPNLYLCKSLETLNKLRTKSLQGICPREILPCLPPPLRAMHWWERNHECLHVMSTQCPLLG